MKQIAQTALLDNLKEKISNPVLYTYFFVFLSTNYQNVLFLLYEPLKMSLKINILDGKWSVLLPIWHTFLLIITLTFINALYEYYKQVWHRALQWCLDKTKIKEFVDLDVYERLKVKYEEDKSKLTTAIDRAESISQDVLGYKNKISELIEEQEAQSIQYKTEVQSLNRQLKEELDKTISDTIEPPTYGAQLVEVDSLNGVSFIDENKATGVLRNISSNGLWLFKYISNCIGGTVSIVVRPEGLNISHKEKDIFLSSNHQTQVKILEDLELLVSFGILDKVGFPTQTINITFTLTESGYELANNIAFEGDNIGFDAANNDTFALAQ